MLIYLNGQRNMIIIPKETLEELGNPKSLQAMLDKYSVLIRYSDFILPEADIIDYPLGNNSFGFHEKMAKTWRRRYKWKDFLYSSDAEIYDKALVIDPKSAEKTDIPNKGLRKPQFHRLLCSWWGNSSHADVAHTVVAGVADVAHMSVLVWLMIVLVAGIEATKCCGNVSFHDDSVWSVFSCHCSAVLKW